MNDTTAQPQGRPLSELRALVAADQERWDELAEVWADLMPSEQRQLIAAARLLRDSHDDAR